MNDYDLNILMSEKAELMTPAEEYAVAQSLADARAGLVRELTRHGLEQPSSGIDAWIRQHQHTVTTARFRRLWTSYQQYRQQIVTANLRLAVSMAKKHPRVTDELIQDAIGGLMLAVDKFDPSQGTRFATYATWWIRQQIQISAARQRSVITLTHHNIFGSKRCSDSIMAAVQAACQVVSLDQIVDEDSQFRFGLEVADRAAETDSLVLAEMRQEVQRLLGVLPERDRHIVELYFRFDGPGPNRSLREVAEAMGISKERVRQILERSFEAMSKKATVDEEGTR